jgi:cytochrome c-type biogenesis protein
LLFDISYYGAFGAGLLSFLSPCILPIVPFYLCYLAGISMEQFTDDGTLKDGSRRKVILASVFFALGILTVFTAMGATASVFGQFLRSYFDVLRYVAGILITVLGLHFLGALRIPILYREARINTGSKPVSFVGAYFVGLAFAFGWTPCVGPVLAAILFAAGAQDTVFQGTTLLLTYGLGMTLPFVLAALFASRFMSFMKRFRHRLGTIEKVMGAFLVLFGGLVFFGQVNRIAQWLLNVMPQSLTTIG